VIQNSVNLLKYILRDMLAKYYAIMTMQAMQELK